MIFFTTKRKFYFVLHRFMWRERERERKISGIEWQLNVDRVIINYGIKLNELNLSHAFGCRERKRRE